MTTGCKLRRNCMYGSSFGGSSACCSYFISSVKPPTDGPLDDADDKRLLKYTISLFTVQPASRSPEMPKSTADEASTESQTEIESKPPTSDPLKWFGILVPPALRASQNSFKNAVTEKITFLANLSNEMRSTEIEIRRVRKKIKKLG